jgi:ectoine hydroxylase-related dioxygenase (phytanoyl-CoA dioxygenase family)
LGLDPNRTLTAWIALTASNRENGCLRFVREKSRWRDQGWVERESGEPGRRERRQPDVPDELLEDVVLAAGEMSLHDVYLLHGSGPNLGLQPRLGFAVRFTTPACRPAVGRPPAVLARGRDRYGHFDLQDPPGDADHAAALVGMRQSARQHLETTLHNLKQPVHR